MRQNLNISDMYGSISLYLHMNTHLNKFNVDHFVDVLFDDSIGPVFRTVARAI
jgi:hypothetical protein